MKRITPTVKLFKQIGNEQQWKCNKCESPFDSTVQIDHILPLQYGGDNDRSNLQILCVSCHAKKTQDETSPLTVNDETSSTLDVKSPHTKQEDVLEAINMYNQAIRLPTSPKNHQDRREAIVQALQRLKQSLAVLSGRKDFCFSRSCDIKWSADGHEIPIDWVYLCQWCNIYINKELYLGVIQQNRQCFNKAVCKYL